VLGDWRTKIKLQEGEERRGWNSLGTAKGRVQSSPLPPPAHNKWDRGCVLKDE